MSKDSYTLLELEYVMDEYDFNARETKAIAWFIQTLMNVDFSKVDLEAYKAKRDKRTDKL